MLDLPPSLVGAILGYIFVWIGATIRFTKEPAPAPLLPAQLPRTVAILFTMFRVSKNEGATIEDLRPPSRANTTCFNFWLYRIAYIALAIIFYSFLLHLTIVRQFIQFLIDTTKLYDAYSIIINLFGLDNLVKGIDLTYVSANPLLLAFVVVIVLPVIPPFKAGDEALRRYLYSCAAIPARHRREMGRLKIAPYSVPPSTFSSVESNLVSEGFDSKDIQFDVNATLSMKSLWMKIASINYQIQCCQAEKQYQTTFEALRDKSGEKTKSIDSLNEIFEILKSDAKTYFEVYDKETKNKEEKKEEDSFRQNCLYVLKEAYHMLSRLTLMSCYTGNQRSSFLRKFGFDIKETNPPIPNAEELGWSAVILAIFVSLPMSQFMGSLVGAFSVTAIIYTIILTPILMATFFPNWARPWRPRIPRISFALSCGAAAAVLGMLGASLIVGDGDVVSGFERYRERVYPFSFLHALWATLIGASITIGAYPDVTKLRRWQRYRQWGSLTEGLIAACLSFGVMWFYVN